VKRCLERERKNTHKARRTRTVCLDRNLDGFVFPLEERLTSRTPRPEDIFIVYSTMVVVLRVRVRNYLKWGFQKYNIVTKSIVSNRRENGIESIIGVVARSLDVIPRFEIIVVVVSRSLFLLFPSHFMSRSRVSWRLRNLVFARFSLSSCVGRLRFLRVRGARYYRPRRPHPRRLWKQICSFSWYTR
jgi:hypothetical protein